MLKNFSFVLFFALIFLGGKLVAQIKLSGTTLDSLGAPLPYSTIAVFKDTTLIKGTFASEKGNFFFDNLSSGKYILKISSTGYNDLQSDTLIYDSLAGLSLPPYRLNGKAINLMQLEIAATKKTIEFKSGNIIINVENSPLAAGNTVFDLLKRAPGVSVDNNNIISLQGKDGVGILINERLQMLNDQQIAALLKSMNAQQVEKIEVLLNPGVKYDAQGSTGLINIVMKRATVKGISGNVFANASQGNYGRSDGGFSFNYGGDKITFFSSVSTDLSDYGNSEVFIKNFHSSQGSMVFNNYSSNVTLGREVSETAGLDIKVSDKNVFGIRADASQGIAHGITSGRNYLNQNNYLGFDHLDCHNDVPDIWSTVNLNLNDEQKFDTLGSQLSFATDYKYLQEDFIGDFQNSFLTADNIHAFNASNFKSTNKTFLNIYSAKSDYKKFFSKTFSLEAGIKASYLKTDNEYIFNRQVFPSGNYERDSLFSNHYTYSEKTGAAYLSFLKAWEKLELNFGVRAENTRLDGFNKTTGFILKRNYLQVFPDVSVNWNKNDNNVFQLFANRRVDRPDFADMNPSRSYRDVYSYWFGNPFLLPSFTTKTGFSHTYKEVLTNSFTWLHIDNFILAYTEQSDSTAEFKQSNTNIKISNRFLYTLYFQKDFKKWWSASWTGNFAWFFYKGDINGAKLLRNAPASYFTFDNNFLLSKTWKLESFLCYFFPKLNGTVNVKSNWALSIGINKTCCKEKLTISLGVDDIFYTAFYRTYSKFENQDWNFKVKNDTQRVRFGLSYNFGKLKTELRETESNEDEQKRAGH